MTTARIKPFLTLLLLFSIQLLKGQTVIWLEDFSGAPPAPGWDDSNFTDCDGTAASFNGVMGGRYEITDMEGLPCCPAGGGNDNTWVTNDINITGFCNVTISVNYGSVGTFECVAGGPFFGCSGNVAIDNGHDQIVFEYSLDGGPWIQFGYVCGGGGGVITVAGLSGTNIRVRISPANKATAETYWFDDVKITGVQPTVNPVNDITVCAGTQVPVNFTGTGTPPPTFDWTNDNTAIGLGAMGSGNIVFTPPASLATMEIATITVTPVAAGCSGPPETFTITVNPLPLTDDPADVVACAGDMVDIVFSGSDPAATYVWTINGLPPNPLFPASGTGNISGTVPPIPFPVTGTVTVHAEVGTCIGPNQTFTVNLLPAVSATFTMTSPAVLCGGQLAAFTVNFSGGSAPYTFIYAIDGVEQAPVVTNNDPYNFTLSLPADATISSVSMMSGSGCVAAVDGSFDVQVSAAPTATLTPGPSSICLGDPLDLQIDFNGTDDYTFIYAINGIQQPAIMAPGPSYNLNANPPIGSTTYSLISVTSNGCTGTASGTHVVTVSALPSAFISGSPNSCAGQTVSIPVTFTGTAPWTFVYSIDGVDQPPITTSNSPYQITNGYMSSVTLDLVNVSSGNCSGTVSGSATVTVTPGVTGVLSGGSAGLCVGQSDTLDFTFTGAAPYTFTYSVNGTAQAPVTTSNSVYQIAVTPGIPTTYTLVSVTNGSCPGGSASGTYMVNVGVEPTATIAGSDTICRENSAPLSITFTGAAPWTFAYAANGIPVDTITTSLNPYIITVSPTATTTYTLTSVSSGSCTGSISGIATIRVNPNPTVVLTGGGQICQNGGGTNLIFTFTGTAPWTVTYQANNDTLTATSLVSPLVLPVNPNIGTIYKLIEISDSLCTDTAVGQVIVFVFTPANAQFLGSGVFCDSAMTQVSIDFTGTGPFTINYAINGVAQLPDTTFDDPYIIPVNVSSTTTYSLISIESPGCTGIITGSAAVITINTAPTYANLNLNCNAVTGTYVVSFDVLGATLPLTATGGNGGSFTGAHWTSNPIPQVSGYSFTFHDANNCGSVTVSGASTCNCLTEAGTMSLSQIEACESQVINAAYNGGFFNDGNDTLLYILHSNPALPVGTIFGWNNTPSFGFLPGMTLGTTYYISAIAGNISASGLVDTSDICAVIAQGTPVVFHGLPGASFNISDTTVCQGQILDFNAFFSGTQPFSFSWSGTGFPPTHVSPLNNNIYNWQIIPTQPVTVFIDSLGDRYCPLRPFKDSVTIDVNLPPAVSNIVSTCDYNTATYVVSFDIISGTAPFNLNGLAGFFSGNTFTSIPIPFASGNFFATLSDANHCGSDTISGMSNCNCSGDAGTMDQVQVNTCANTTLNVPAAQNPAPDADDLLMYILHTNPDVPLGTILAWSSTPSFTFGGAMQTGVVYYISSMVGNPDGNGMIDLLDPCLDVAPGTPVQWLPTPTATLANGSYDICPGQSQALLINFTGTPRFTLGYTNNNNANTIPNIPQTTFFFNATLQQTATFVLTSISDSLCTGTVSGSATINVHPAPGADNFVTNCDQLTQTYTVEFDIAQGDLNTIVVANLPGTYNPGTGHFVSNPIPNGQPYSVLITDSWNCGNFTFSDVVNCACTTNAGIMDPSVLHPCFGQTVSTSAASGVSLESGDTLLYFLVSQSNSPLSWTIVDVNDTPDFVFNPATMMSSITYYIVAVAGNIGGPNGVDLSDPCLSVSAGPTVIWHPEITATLSGTPEVCPGSTVGLSVQFTGDGPFNFSYTDGLTPQSLSGISQNPYTLSVPSASASYVLVNVTGADNCPGTIGGTGVVTVSNPPQVLNLLVNCDLATETYTLSFDIGNGAQSNPVYTILGITGTLTDTSFVSDPYPGTQTYTVLVSTPNGCTASVTGTPNCVCTTGAGTLSNGVDACLPDGMVTAQAAGDQSLDPDDLLLYVLCADPSNLPIGIIAQSLTPEFSFQAGITAGLTYYIVAIAGNNLNGSVDLADPCLSFSPGVPVVFNFQPTALILGDKTLCEGNNAIFQVQLAGVEPFQFVYAVNGIAQPQVSTSNSSFNILSNNVQQDQVFTLVSVSDQNCPGIVDGQATITVAPTPKGSISSDISICAGDSTLLTLQLSGGSTYDVTISGTVPPTQLTGVQNGASFLVAPTGTTTYTITSLTAPGTTCPAALGQGATVTTSSVDATSVLSDFNGFNTSCPLTDDGSIMVTPIGGINPITASWSNGFSGLSNTNLSAGQYTVTLTDQIGCTYTNDFNLNAPPELSIEFSTDSPTCFGDHDGSLSISGVSGGAGPFAISVNNVLVQSSDVFPVTVPALASGIQLITVEDANGCLSDAEATVTDPAELMVNLGPDTTIHLGDEILLHADLSFIDYASFVWTPVDYLRRPDSLSTLSSPLNSIRYAITVKDSAGCIARDEILVIVEKEKRVYVPNIINPDSDTDNNILTVFAGTEVTQVLSMRIFDRWGELVFENLNFLPNLPEFGWDGKVKGEAVNPAVYVYVIEVEYINGETEVISGDVTVVR